MATPGFPTSGAVLDKLKSDGTFDFFRRMCVSSVQEEPSFRAQKEHVEILSRRFLQDYNWSSSTTKNEVRTKMRAFVLDEIKKPGVHVETSLEKLVDKTLETKTKELLPKILAVMEVLQQEQQSTSSEVSTNPLYTNGKMLQLSSTCSATSVPLATTTTTTTTASTSTTSFELPMDLLELASSSSAISHVIKRDGHKSTKMKPRASADGAGNKDSSRAKPAGSSKPVKEKKEDVPQKQESGESGKLLTAKDLKSVKEQKGTGTVAPHGQDDDKALEVKSLAKNPSSLEAHEELKEARHTKDEPTTKGADSLVQCEQLQQEQPVPDLPPVTTLRPSGSMLGNQDSKLERKRRLSSSSSECQRREGEELVRTGDGFGAVVQPKSKRQKKLMHKGLPRIPLKKRRAVVFSSSSDAETSEHESHKQEEHDSDKEHSTLKGTKTVHHKKRKMDTMGIAPSELQVDCVEDRLSTEVTACHQDKNSNLVKKTEAVSLSLVVTRYNRTVKPNRKYAPSSEHSDSEQEVDAQLGMNDIEETKEELHPIERKSAAKNWRRKRKK